MSLLRTHLPPIVAAGAVLLLLVVGTVAAPGFGTPQNLLTVLGLTSFIGIVALGQGAVMLTGGIDLLVAELWAVVVDIDCGMRGARHECLHQPRQEHERRGVRHAEREPATADARVEIGLEP